MPPRPGVVTSAFHHQAPRIARDDSTQKIQQNGITGMKAPPHHQSARIGLRTCVRKPHLDTEIHHLAIISKRSTTGCT